MRLRGRITKLESGKSYTDGLERVTIKVSESTSPMYSDFTVPNTEGLELDQELQIVLTVMGRPELVAEAERENKVGVAHGA